MGNYIARTLLFTIFAFRASHQISSRTCCIRTLGAQISARAINTISKLSPVTHSSANKRIDSRNKRRARLRFTAFPNFLVVMNPTRITPTCAAANFECWGGTIEACGRVAIFNEHNFPCQRDPNSRTRLKSSDVQSVSMANGG